jgi:hypothetical protein
MYLTSVEQGGETVFPHGQKLSVWEDEASLMDPGEVFEEDSWEYTMVKLCRSSLATKPIQGEAVLFYSQTPSGALDPYSEHGGCPVLKGDKWGANLWVWNGARLTMKSGYTVTFTNKLLVQVNLYFFFLEKKSETDIGERTIEFLATLEPGAMQSFKCYSGDVFMAKTAATDAIINLYEIKDNPARGPVVMFDIDNLREDDAVKRARTYEFMKGFELGYRGGHSKGFEEGVGSITPGLRGIESKNVATPEKGEL